jgi:hypothetical protein
MRFLAYLALSGGATLDATALCAQTRAMWPGTPGTDLRPILDLAGQAATGDGQGFMLEAANQRFTILFVDTPLPPDTYAAALDLAQAWPEAPAVMAGHAAHVVIAAASNPTTLTEKRNTAAAMSLIVAALTTLLPGLAVVWSIGDALSTPAGFRDAIIPLQRHEIPVAQWIGFRWLRAGPTLRGEPQWAVLTTGLEPFIGREIEFLPSPMPPATIMDRLARACTALLTEAATVDDDELAGISHTERIRLRRRDRGTRSGIPVLQLTAESIAAVRFDDEPRAFGRKRAGSSLAL